MFWKMLLLTSSALSIGSSIKVPTWIVLQSHYVEIETINQEN